MKADLTRKQSYIIIGVVYLLTAALGVAVYILTRPLGAFWIRLLLADVSATVLTFIFSLIFKNASVYDPYWSVQPIVILVGLAVGQRLSLIKLVLLLTVLLWGIRLTANWAYTFKSMKHEDWRYRMLHEKTGKAYPVINFVGIHMVPTLVVYLCTLPAAAMMLGSAKGNLIAYAGVAVSLCAVVLQGISDVQMHKFRKSGKGGFIRDGFWRNSRHPNYLGEILMWWGVGICSVAALGASYAYLLVGAVANTALFVLVSIPLAEGKQAKKEGYAEYCAETRVLFPIAKKK